MPWQPLEQTLIPSLAPRIFVRHYAYRDVAELGREIWSYNHREVLGIAIQLSKQGDLRALAISFTNRVFLYTLDPPIYSAQPEVKDAAFGSVLGGGHHATLAGFNMARLALHIHRDLGYDVNAVDLSTLLGRDGSTEPWTPSMCIQRVFNQDIDRHRIDQLWYGPYGAASEHGADAEERLCFRAWISGRLAEQLAPQVRIALRVSTRRLREEHLRCLAQMVINIELGEAAKPTLLDHEFDQVGEVDNHVVLQNTRFSTRIRPSAQTTIVMSTSRGQDLIGEAVHAKGRETKIRLRQGQFRGGVRHVQVIGREEMSGFEIARETFLLRLLRAQTTLEDRPFLSLLAFPTPDLLPRPRSPTLELVEPHDEFASLNESQCAVAAAMLSYDEPMTIVHGPPGTGKTTTIAAAVKYWETNSKPVWIVAQSNVGVKNIASSLIRHGVSKFKLLVAKEFYVGWHEHLYTRMQTHLIRSDDLRCDTNIVELKFAGARIVLCTIGMLFHPLMVRCGVFNIVPMERLVVDEASQIDSSDLMLIFHKFWALRKVCLFGDPKQLPPFGQDVAPAIQSIFDIEHLQPYSYFLNTQYRMPVQLGHFVSGIVYEGRLASEHWLQDMSCVSFVDVDGAHEEHCGKSWKNLDEVDMIVHLVRHYYRDKDFCIITPYDAQRAAIYRRLKIEALPHERIYNVDSFQGHEAAFIIVSPVRTKNPGFLRQESRMTVMLTRCEAGMVVVTNRRFVREGGRHTLLGKLAAHWEAQLGPPAPWVNANSVMSLTANMPGVTAAEAQNAPRGRRRGLSPTYGYIRRSLLSRIQLQPPQVVKHRTSLSPELEWDPPLADNSSAAPRDPTPQVLDYFGHDADEVSDHATRSHWAVEDVHEDAAWTGCDPFMAESL